MLRLLKRARRRTGRRSPWAIATALWHAGVVDEPTAKRFARELEREDAKAARREELARG